MKRRESLEASIQRILQLQVQYRGTGGDLYTFGPAYPPATEAQLHAVERKLGTRLAPWHREFLLLANGWMKVDGNIHVFSAEDILESPQRQAVLEDFKDIYLENLAEDAEAIEASPALYPELALMLPFLDAQLIPVGQHWRDGAVLVTAAVPHPEAGSILWCDGSHTDVFPDFLALLSHFTGTLELLLRDAGE